MSLGELAGDFRTTETSVTFLGSITQLIGQDPKRWALLLGFQAGPSSQWVTTLASGGSGTGLLIGSAFPTLALNFRDHGSLVQVPWFLNASGPCNVTVVSVQYWPTGERDDSVSAIHRVERAINDLTRQVLRR